VVREKQDHRGVRAAVVAVAVVALADCSVMLIPAPVVAVAVEQAAAVVAVTAVLPVAVPLVYSCWTAVRSSRCVIYRHFMVAVAVPVVPVARGAAVDWVVPVVTVMMTVVVPVTVVTGVPVAREVSAAVVPAGYPIRYFATACRIRI